MASFGVINANAFDPENPVRKRTRKLRFEIYSLWKIPVVMEFIRIWIKCLLFID